MKLPAVAMTTAFALGIACGLNPVIAQHNSSHEFVAVLLCSAATSLLIGIFLCVALQPHWRGGWVAIVLGDARGGGGLYPGTEASGSCFESGERRENQSQNSAAILRAVSR
jgi:hypothetical protein